MSERLNQLFKDEIELGNQIRCLTNKRIIIRQQIANLKCPFKIGDVVHAEYQRKDYKVSKIIYTDCQDNYRLFGYKLKKNGKPSLMESRLYDFDGPFTKVDT